MFWSSYSWSTTNPTHLDVEIPPQPSPTLTFTSLHLASNTAACPSIAYTSNSDCIDYICHTFLFRTLYRSGILVVTIPPVLFCHVGFCIRLFFDPYPSFLTPFQAEFILWTSEVRSIVSFCHYSTAIQFFDPNLVIFLRTSEAHMVFHVVFIITPMIPPLRWDLIGFYELGAHLAS